MTKLMYAFANKLVLPLFPFGLILILKKTGGAADEFFIYYTLSILLSSVSDFGFRFHPYKVVNVSNPMEYAFNKTLLSLFAIVVFVIISIFVYGGLSVSSMILGLCIPFYGLADPVSHYLKAGGRQKELFRVTFLCWFVSLIVLTPLVMVSLELYAAMLILISSASRYIASGMVVKINFGNYIDKNTKRDLIYTEGLSVFSFMLKGKVVVLLFPILFPYASIAIFGVALGVISKLSELGVALYEVKIEINKKVIVLLLIVLVFISCALALKYGLYSNITFISLAPSIVIMGGVAQFYRINMLANGRSIAVLMVYMMCTVVITLSILSFATRMEDIVYFYFLLEAINSAMFMMVKKVSSWA